MSDTKMHQTGNRPQTAPLTVQQLSRLATLSAELYLFQPVIENEIGRAWLDEIKALLALATNGASDWAVARGAHAQLFRLLSGYVPRYCDSGTEPWKAFLRERVLETESVLSRFAEAGMQPGSKLLDAAEIDLKALSLCDQADGAALASTLRALGPGARASEVIEPPSILGRPAEDGRMPVRFGEPLDWSSLLSDLMEFWSRGGAGPFARARAFKWVRLGEGRELRPIPNSDPVTLEELVGYDVERALLLANTRQFVAGLPANNVLIYGDRGTGKSSTVKALVNAHWQQGLRLIEVHKHDLDDYPMIVERVRGRPQRFILFIDDLSFDEGETEYKELKAILEGGVEMRPANLLLYATSNRRHLIQERFADRLLPSDEVHSQDAVQEKLSLADRFGITVTFGAPDQDRYLTIVRSLAARRGLEIPTDDLRRRALQWAAWHNGRSGRCARQFVDHLEGEMALGRR